MPHKSKPYWEIQRSGINEQALPQKIKCGRCGKNKAPPNFSKKQLSDYQERAAKKLNATANCRHCTGQQVVEMECVMCKVTKGLDDFAKAQRANPDRAKCMECMENQLELNPVEEAKYDDKGRAISTAKFEDSYITYFDEPTSTASIFGTTATGSVAALGANLASLELTDSAARSTTSTVGYEDSVSQADQPAATNAPAALGGDGWKLAAGKSWRSASTRGGSVIPSVSGLGTASPSTVSRFDPAKYGRPGGVSVSASVTGSGFGSNITEGTEKVVYKNGFAKVPAYKAAPKQQEPEWLSDDEEKKKGEDDTDDDDEQDDEDNASNASSV